MVIHKHRYMKRILLTLVSLLVLLPVSAQEKVIDMDSFKGYLAECSMAKDKKDRAKLKELRAEKGREYDINAIIRRVKQSEYHGYYGDKEACAFLAAYCEVDYYQKWRKTDLYKAIKYYEEALERPLNSHNNDKEKMMQVKLHYARFLIMFESQSQMYVNDLVKVGALKKGYYDKQLQKDVVYSNEELRKHLVNKIARLIQESGDAGYDVGAYYWARLIRGYSVPSIGRSRYGGTKLLEGVWVWHNYYSRKYFEKLQGLGDADYPLRNENVVKYYTIAASGGKPQYQMEFAEYLLRTMCRGWMVSWTLSPYERPFIQDYRKWVFDGNEFVRNESSNSEIEEQLSYWYLQAAKQDYTPAMVDLAFCMFYEMHPYDGSLHYSEIVHWLEKASNLGDPTAMYNLSVVKLLDDGRVVTRQDSLDAFYWARRGADSGDFKCQHLLGRYYYNGIGVKLDKKEALRWFKGAADKGSQGAAYMAGKLYADKTVGNDMELAVKYYESAKWIPEAYMALAELYDKGNGVIMDKQKAREYQKKAEGGAFYVGSNLNDYAYRLFIPGLCFYSFSDYFGQRNEPSLIKQVQL